MLNHIDKKTVDIQISVTKIEKSLSTLSEQVQELETFVGVPTKTTLMNIVATQKRRKKTIGSTERKS